MNPPTPDLRDLLPKAAKLPPECPNLLAFQIMRKVHVIAALASDRFGELLAEDCNAAKRNNRNIVRRGAKSQSSGWILKSHIRASRSRLLLRDRERAQYLAATQARRR